MADRISFTQPLTIVLLTMWWTSIPIGADIAIDEVLADPPAGAAGDANRDGVRTSYQDEFIELFNAGPDTVSLAGWRLGDDDGALHTLFVFADSVRLAPQSRLLLFGGGAPTGFAVPVFVDDGRIGNGLSNSGDRITLLDAAGDTVDSIALAKWPKDQSLVRTPTSSDSLVPHTTVSPTGEPFSPGRAISTTAIDSASATPEPQPPNETIAPPETPEPQPPNETITPRPEPDWPILITEVLADPPSGAAGDANQDGTRSTYEDEFVEFHNTSADTIPLAGWLLGDDDVETSAYFRFPENAFLPPKGFAVVFGGGAPTGFTAPVFTDNGRIGNGLTNTGDRLLLLNAAADTVLDFTFTSRTKLGASIVRSKTHYIPHNQLPGRDLFSPGQTRKKYDRFSILAPDLVEGTIANLTLIGHNSTGADSLATPDLQWISTDPRIALIRPGSSIRGLRPGHTYLQCWQGSLLLAQLEIEVRSFEPPNTSPIIISQPDTLAFTGGWYRYSVRATDPEHHTLVFTFVQAPDWLDLDGLSGLIQGRTPLTSGVFEIAFEAADGRGGLSAQRYNLHLVPRPKVRIDEVLSDPPPGAPGDANQDGHRHTYEDEFVELYNADQIPIDLGGISLSDGDGSPFTFPRSTILAPGGRAVVFGGGNPRGSLFFSAGGRIGDGLGNRRDEIVLIGASGLDTLDRFAYDLDRDPNQSLVDDGHTMHAAWPGRDPSSPGLPRPLLQTLRPSHRRLNLVQGQHRRLHLLGRYSDGKESPAATDAIWTSSDSRVASISQDGTLIAINPGTCQFSIHLDHFAIAPCSVQVRAPLATSIRFAPAWDETTLSSTRRHPFIVRSKHSTKQSYYWSLNGHRLPVMAPQYLHLPSAFRTDTIHIEIRRGFERIARQWILHPPAAKPRAATHNRPLKIWPNPFNSTTKVQFYQSRRGHVQIVIYDLKGQRVQVLADASFNAGSHQISWNGSDQRGHLAATGIYFVRLTTHSTQTHAKLLLLR